MKRIKYLLLLVIILPLASCGFVNYVKTETTNIEEVTTLNEAKTKYINLLNESYNESDYYEEEKREFIETMVEMKARINECTDSDSVVDIYNECVEIINEIKTKEYYYQLDLKNAKESSIENILSITDLSSYREVTQEEVLPLMNETIQKINDASNKDEISKIVSKYIEDIYVIRTNEEIYVSELNTIKTKLENKLYWYLDRDLYSAKGMLSINSIIDDFSTELELLELKEDTYTLYDEYVLLLDDIESLSDNYENRKLRIVDSQKRTFYKNINYNHLSDTEKEYYDNFFDSLVNVKTIEKIKDLIVDEKIKLVIDNAILNKSEALRKYKKYISEKLEYYLDQSLYRENEIAEILNIISTSKNNITNCSTYDEVVAEYDLCKSNLDLVKTNDDLWSEEDNAFINTLNDIYGANVLEVPTSLNVANSYQELANIIDYYAFYQLNGSSFLRSEFRVKINFSFNSAKYLKNEVYWYSELLNGAVGITAKRDIDYDYVVFELIPYDFAIISTESENNRIDKYTLINNYNSTTTSTIRTEDFDNFKYYNNTKTIDGVWNSQQLWYALEHNYIPNCVAGSEAESLLNKAKTILREIVNDNMNDYEKIYAIYNWIGDNIQFDYAAYNYIFSSDMDKYPAENYSQINSLFLEGGLNDGYAICAGFAKTYLTLLKIEGIDAIKVIARSNLLSELNTINPSKYISYGYGFHEFVYIKINGKWYYSDPERSNLENDISLRSNIYIMLSPLKQDYGFTVINDKIDINDTDFIDYYSNIYINNKSCYNSEDYKNIIDEFSKTGKEKEEISLIFSNSDSEKVKEYIATYSNLSYMEHALSYNDSKIIELVISII